MRTLRVLPAAEAEFEAAVRWYDDVEVVAIAHMRRRAGYWTRRDR